MDRSQSATLGVALVFALVLVGTTVIVVMSAGAITETEDQISIERAEQTLTQLDAEMAKVALGNTESGTIDLGQSDRAYAVDADAGWIKVKRATGTNPLGKTSLGEISYARGGTTIAYQGGGVWKRTPDNGTVMVSPPEFHFRDGTLTLPIIALSNSDGSISGRATMAQSGPPSRVFPSGSNTNPVPAGVTVVVKSEYYEAWGTYFEERTDGAVEYDHDANTVELDLVTPIGTAKAKNSLLALNSGGVLDLSGAGEKLNKDPTACSGNTKVYSDSYDSSNGDYCPTRSNNGNSYEGDVIYGGEIDVSSGSGNSVQFGEMKSDVIDCAACDKYTVHGDVGSDTCPSGNCGDLPATGYSYYSPVSLGTTSSLDFAVLLKSERLSDPDNNDNGDASDISGTSLSGGAPYSLTAGEYYLDRIDLAGDETLELDTTSGDITLVVEEWVDVCDGQIEVTGPHEVELWVEGADTIGSSDYHFNVDNGGKVDAIGPTSDRNSTKFVVVSGKDFAVELGNPSVSGMTSANCAGNGGVFEGVVYSPIDPPPSGGSAQVNIKQGHVFGGVVTGDTYLGSSSALHYDEALKTTQLVDPNTKVASITYLHISVNEVEVSG